MSQKKEPDEIILCMVKVGKQRQLISAATYESSLATREEILEADSNLEETEASCDCAGEDQQQFKRPTDRSHNQRFNSKL
jgi:hypothetical protein